ncbi:MAG: acetyl-CoA carboxylase carboxyl transferase subunit alpha [Gammaproteobacteria bacterium]|jgi:acetyl-CoA carboxylase carboxyl transferase subunit alpha|nr:acetyl-CoA carboxylase carboxyl transferase subunit alpha [Gammaproteobacteria bacterium]|tara:strand:- start:3687 stop:4631 length:945 start_codon:yes stop_codon:yes gene_type:complete
MLEFEEPIKNLEDKIEELRSIGSDGKVNIVEEINVLQKKCNTLIKDIYSNLTPWQITQIARHPDRPYTMDYIKSIFKNFHELHGDRAYADDNAIISGIAQFKDTSVVVVGHQKGRGTNDKIKRNFGMAKPEGFRKALRVMKLAERFNMPIITFIDTPGAYPGIDAEERGQSEAIANNLLEMSDLSVPILSYVIGEGGSGGALAIGVCDHLTMLEYSIYSVISPEGCASILWKSPENANLAAEAMCITADNLQKLKLIDELIAEPLGGAHRNASQVSKDISLSISKNLDIYFNMDLRTLINNRKDKLSSVGYYQD